MAKGKWSFVDVPKVPGVTYRRGRNSYVETPHATLHWYAGDFEDNLDTTLHDAYERIGQLLQGDIKDNMTTSHPVSLPGEPPAVQTGRLRRSIDYELIEKHDGVRVGTNVEYGKYLELGTRRILPRPFMVPALQRNKHRIEEELKGLVK